MDITSAVIGSFIGIWSFYHIYLSDTCKQIEELHDLIIKGNPNGFEFNEDEKRGPLTEEQVMGESNEQR